MNLVIGTAQGVFVADPHGRVKAAAGIEQRNLRHLSRVNGDLLAGTNDGVTRSSDGGFSWRPSGIAGFFVWDVAAAPDDPHTLYAATEPAALFRSRDEGQSWVEMSSFRQAPGAAEWCLPRTTIAGRARTIVVDRNQPAHVLVGIEVGGVYETHDAGASWRFTRPGGNPDIHVIVAHPQRSGLVFASTGFGRPEGTQEPMEKRIAGVFGSADGGATWDFMWQGMRPPYT
ncbi:MAG: WD40/YVTN/BNR-like repeat-containing protein, partial [Candidatus Rokuibacteriota bacterium]